MLFYPAETHVSRSFTWKNFKKVILKLNPKKATEPDGLISSFYKASLGIIGKKVIEAMQNFFQSEFLSSAANATILTMVPKKPKASIIDEYIPISCYSILYKYTAKLLVTKHMPILPGPILSIQTAFVQGRLLVENTILATELVSGITMRKSQTGLLLRLTFPKSLTR